jgi:cell wall assembly regulator SMI1/ankyrin repeat protein
MAAGKSKPSLGAALEKVLDGVGATEKKILKVKALIDEGLPLNEACVDDAAYTPLGYAVKRGEDLPLIELLLKAGAKVDALCDDGETPLMIAAIEGHLPLVKRLLAAGANPNHFDLERPWVNVLTKAAIAESDGPRGIVEALLAAGAKPTGSTLASAADSSLAVVKMLIAAGGDIHADGNFGTPLHVAAAENLPDNVRLLLAEGADVNFRLPANHKNYPKETALDRARKEKARKVIPILEAAMGGTAAASAAPKPQSIDAIWKQLLATDSGLKKKLRAGAKPAKLATFEAVLGCTLPLDVRESYLQFDGQKSGDGMFIVKDESFDEEYAWMSLDEAQAQWTMMQELAAEGEFKGAKAKGETGVRSTWWHAQWIPIATDGGGNYLCVDLAPAMGGASGQIIGFRHDSAKRELHAASFSDLLTFLL